MSFNTHTLHSLFILLFCAATTSTAHFATESQDQPLVLTETQTQIINALPPRQKKAFNRLSPSDQATVLTNQAMLDPNESQKTIAKQAIDLAQAISRFRAQQETQSKDQNS